MVLLGSTGSIGTNTLNIAREFDLKIETLVAGENIDLLNAQIAEFRPSVVVIKDASKADLVQSFGATLLYGEEGILEAIQRSESDLVVNSLVGFAGLKPTIKAIECGKRVALANKESLVCAGAFIDMDKIVPIDSEHFGLWYLLNGRDVKKMTITASGGAFRDTPLQKLESVTVQEALAHPNWSMGKKITIDSATMTNKLFELLEARWLFGVKELDAIIETKSIIHALVDFVDGSTTAHIAGADMRLPIAFALLGNVQKEIVKPIDLLQVGSFEFREISPQRYPIWQIKDDLLKNPHLGVVINCANELAIERFFEKKIGFLDISRLTLKAFEKFYDFKPTSLEQIYQIDQEIRKFL
ncbi:MAG: 1-deoxy-D-xylulose-5-phosphate reductoisomerase [Sulfurospirillum sp.]|nr:MAG: 1-deoxy-D-xylulose-5-phosphate reductoisomerase [Sulfurospirillum sp.]